MTKHTLLLIFGHILVATLVMASLGCTGADTGEQFRQAGIESEQSDPNTIFQESPVDTSIRDVSSFSMFQPQISGAMFNYEIPDTETVLESGLYGLGASPAHIAILGTPVGNSVRCHWHGLARTSNQREESLRLVLGLSATDTLPTATAARSTLNSYVALLAPEYRDAMQTNFNHIVDGGLLEDSQILACYVDYTVSEYVLGAGPATVTVVYDNLLKMRAYDLYVKARAAGRFGSGGAQTRSAYAAAGNRAAIAAEAQMHGVVNGREGVIFLAPMGSHHGVAVEAWQAVAQWDIQTKNGVKHAVRYGAHGDAQEYSQTLSSLKTRITTAAASDSHAGKRIANTSGLNKHYRDMGAYGDITPNDGSTETFTPSQPPAIPACVTGTAAGNPTSNRELARDCSALLAGYDTLRGSGGRLNWGKNLAMTEWLGVVVSQTTPRRVSALYLESNTLRGTIPKELTTLIGLKILDLSNNSLTGEIPDGLADLPLTTLELAGNRFTGCIPEELRDIQTHDLNQLRLPYCDSLVPGTITDLSTSQITTNQVNVTWTKPDSGSSPLRRYRLQRKTGDEAFVDVETNVAPGLTSYLVQQLQPGTQYTFRIAAINSNGRSEWSNLATATTLGGTPNQVTEFSAATRGETSITLRWRAPSDNGSTITGYKIQRRTAGTNFADISTTLIQGMTTESGGLEYADTGLSKDTEYFYQIKAANSYGSAANWSSEVNARTALLAPPGVSIISALAIDSTRIAISWQHGVGDNQVTNYELQRRTGTAAFAGVATVAGSLTSYINIGLTPGTTYTYRIRATNSVGASAWSENVQAATLPSPVFSQGSYSFAIYGGSPVGTVLGTLSATPGTGSAVTYHLVGGGAGKFVINETTGVISTTNTLLDYDTVSAYTLQVEARDASPQRASVTVAVSVVAPCTDGITIVNPSNNPLLVSDCKTLIAMEDTLRGTGSLNWSGGLPMSRWDGVEFHANVSGVYILNLPNKGLNGIVPAGLADLSTIGKIKLEKNQLTGSIPVELASRTSLTTLWLNHNRLTGTIPKELSSLWRLSDLRLHYNGLTGSIPKELGGLGNMAVLVLNNNQLSGSLPVELGNMSSLNEFRAENNSLTGTLPAELANPPNLQHLYLLGNSLTGCVPRVFASIENTDVLSIGHLCAE